MKRFPVFLMLLCFVTAPAPAPAEEEDLDLEEREEDLDLEEENLDLEEEDLDLEEREEDLDLEEREEEEELDLEEREEDEDLDLEEREEDDMWSDDEELALVERKYKQQQWPEGATDEAVLEGTNVAINARAMQKLMKSQDVVSTCRYLLFKAHKTFYESKEACENFEWPFTHTGIGMASVKSESDNDDIRTLLQIAYGMHWVGNPYNRDNWVWVGLHKKIDNDRILEENEKGDFNPTHWNWTDGSNPTYSNWWPLMPDQQWDNKLKTFQIWVQINKKGYWDDTHNGKSAPYACNYCGKYIVIESKVSWTHAQELCESYGLTMAIVDSAADNLELAWAANITFGPETAEKRWNATNWIWLGTQEIMDVDGNGTGVWEHHDGSALSWEPVWDKKRQPDNWVRPRGEQQVVAFSRITQKWDDSFMWKHRPFACMCTHRSCEYAG